MELLYLGNVSGKFGAQPSQMELLIPILQKNYEVRYGSPKKNIVARAFHFLILIFQNRRHADLILLDVYSSKYFYGILLASQLARVLGKNYICILRGGNLPIRLRKNTFLSRLIFGSAKKLIAPSEYLKFEFEKFGYSADIIYNSVEHHIFRKSTPRKTIRPRMLYVRSLLLDYNPLMAVQILKELTKCYPEAFLCMIGVTDKTILNEINEFVVQNDLQNNFVYKGFLPKDEWLKMSLDYDIYLSTPNIDNAPVSLLEAYNLGMLVASTDVGGVPYIAEHNKTAILFKPGDFLTASNLLYDVLKDQNRARKICEEGHNYGQKFSLSRIIIDWYKLLDNIDTGNNESV